MLPLVSWIREHLTDVEFYLQSGSACLTHLAFAGGCTVGGKKLGPYSMPLEPLLEGQGLETNPRLLDQVSTIVLCLSYVVFPCFVSLMLLVICVPTSR
ncbi:hypothetical protein KC19_VG332100 [Ceratodon purpureus]|uniref:Uncharacterized protein n=1 Tax=Ceratodon purpureus TaxID=3225 RepID=A0A8T0HW07_CERPU|nr:hypothetical protein KC19_VG332100 [Ceratodon purpureus]